MARSAAPIVKLTVRPKRQDRLWATLRALAENLGRRGRGLPTARPNPFAPAPPLPGVVGEGRDAKPPQIAMDAAELWKGAFDGGFGPQAQGGLGFLGGPMGSYALSAYAEGQEWLGYAVLALLTQRPEYRIMVETTASEMTREWIKFKSKSNDKSKQKKIEQIEERLKELDLQGVMKAANVNDGFQGRGQVYVDCGDPEDRDELRSPLTPQAALRKYGKKKFITRLGAIEPMWCYPAAYEASDPLKVTWYKPTLWWVMGKEVHRDRLLTFVGNEVADIIKPAYSFGGIAMTQMAKPYVDFWLRDRTSESDLLCNFSMRVLGTELDVTTQDEGSEIFQRALTINTLADNQGLLLYNKSTEEFDIKQTSLGGVPEITRQSAERLTIPSRMPIVKFFGNQPSGLNADSEGVIRMWYDQVKDWQEGRNRPTIQTIVNLVEIELFGEVDDDIVFEFVGLWQLDEAGKQAVELTKAQVVETDVAAGLVSPQEGRLARAKSDDSPYVGLDLEEGEAPGERMEEEQAAMGGGGEEDPIHPKPQVGTSQHEARSIEGQAASFGGPATGGLKAANDIWHEEDHPRGQPGNAGQFGSSSSFDPNDISHVKILAREMGWNPSDREVRVFAEYHPDEAGELLERGLSKRRSKRPSKEVSSTDIRNYAKTLSGINPSYRSDPLDIDALKRDGAVEPPPVVIHNTSSWNAGDLTSLQARLGKKRALKEFASRWPDASREQAEVDIGLVWTSDAPDRGHGGLNLAINASKVPDLDWYIPEDEPDGGFVARTIPKDAIIGVVGDPAVDREISRLSEEYSESENANDAAEDKLSKYRVDYVGHEVDGDRCGLCENFREPSSCSMVEGIVSPDGHCVLFSAKMESADELESQYQWWLAADEFHESDHPRDKGGKFTAGAGQHAVPEPPKFKPSSNANAQKYIAGKQKHLDALHAYAKAGEWGKIESYPTEGKGANKYATAVTEYKKSLLAAKPKEEIESKAPPFGVELSKAMTKSLHEQGFQLSAGGSDKSEIYTNKFNKDLSVEVWAPEKAGLSGSVWQLKKSGEPIVTGFGSAEFDEELEKAFPSGETTPTGGSGVSKPPGAKYEGHESVKWNGTSAERYFSGDPQNPTESLVIGTGPENKGQWQIWQKGKGVVAEGSDQESLNAAFEALHPRGPGGKFKKKEDLAEPLKEFGFKPTDMYGEFKYTMPGSTGVLGSNPTGIIPGGASIKFPEGEGQKWTLWVHGAPVHGEGYENLVNAVKFEVEKAGGKSKAPEGPGAGYIKKIDQEAPWGKKVPDAELWFNPEKSQFSAYNPNTGEIYFEDKDAVEAQKAWENLAAGKPAKVAVPTEPTIPKITASKELKPNGNLLKEEMEPLGFHKGVLHKWQKVINYYPNYGEGFQKGLRVRIDKDPDTEGHLNWVVLDVSKGFTGAPEVASSKEHGYGTAALQDWLKVAKAKFDAGQGTPSGTAAPKPVPKVSGPPNLPPTSGPANPHYQKFVEGVASKSVLDTSTMTKVGGKLGSNEGGQYQDAEGNKFYVKTTKSADHARNEMLAARLYALAGSPILEYRKAAGADQVATAWTKVDGDPTSFTPGERKAAQRQFAVHAWLANWDAVGLQNDNQGTVDGTPTTLDVGGALEYRAQGGPKGTLFGDSVGEWDTLRDSSKNPTAAALFKDMTKEQLADSVKQITEISAIDIRWAVEAAGYEGAKLDELSKKLVARRNDLGKRASAAMAAPAATAAPPSWETQMGQKYTGLSGSASEISPQKYATAFQDKAHQPTPSQNKAIYDYTDGKYDDMNIPMRKGMPIPEHLQPSIKELRNYLNKASFPEDAIVTRRVSGEYAKELRSKMKVGTIFADHGFVSSDHWSGELTMKIRVPKGSKAAAVKTWSANKPENEIILQAGSRFKVVGYHPGSHIVELEHLPEDHPDWI